MSLQQDSIRGRRAEQLLADDLLTEAFQKLEADYIAGWKATDARDQDGRERLFLAVQIVGKVRAHLQSVAASGSLAKKELEQLNAPKPKRFGIV